MTTNNKTIWPTHPAWKQLRTIAETVGYILHFDIVDGLFVTDMNNHVMHRFADLGEVAAELVRAAGEQQDGDAVITMDQVDRLIEDLDIPLVPERIEVPVDEWTSYEVTPDMLEGSSIPTWAKEGTTPYRDGSKGEVIRGFTSKSGPGGIVQLTAIQAINEADGRWKTVEVDLHVEAYDFDSIKIGRTIDEVNELHAALVKASEHYMIESFGIES